MNVKVAKTAGFCFGVQRAVDRVYELIGSDAAPIYTLGPIIHNEEVVSDLEKKGVAVICEEDLGSLKGGTVVIRSHGVGRKVHEDPEVPNYGKAGHGVRLVNGMVIAIEPMINAGTRFVVQDNPNGWTVRTKDGKLCAHFENTIAITPNGPLILTDPN